MRIRGMRTREIKTKINKRKKRNCCGSNNCADGHPMQTVTGNALNLHYHKTCGALVFISCMVQLSQIVEKNRKDWAGKKRRPQRTI